MDISQIASNIGSHAARLGDARRDIGDGIDWYHYDILANVVHLDNLLHGDNRDLAALAAGRPLADIGGADGDLAFAIEAETGWQIDLVDTAITNQNGLAGARALRERLGSGVTVNDINLDEQFRLPRDEYGLVLLLGILYHLQNPYFVLRELSRRCRHCLVSTRVARFAGPEATPIADIPVAYLVGPAETNGDATNYWMFSPAGLERVVERAGWSVLERMNVGDTERSDPSSPDHDERMFMLLRSTAG